MAAELVLGFHGQLDYKGTRLDGLWPHQQVKVVVAAGVHLFGLVVNTNSRRSTPWNVARAETIVKESSRVAEIPIHANVGMGVGGVPRFEVPPPDVLTRCSAAIIEIGRVDGLQVGTSDPYGMSISHVLASGMGGIRTTGDLVAARLASAAGAGLREGASRARRGQRAANAARRRSSRSSTSGLRT